MRKFTNKPGTTFDPDKTDIVYAEDLNSIGQALQKAEAFPQWSLKFQNEVNHVDLATLVKTDFAYLTGVIKKMIVLGDYVYGITTDFPGGAFRIEIATGLNEEWPAIGGVTSEATDIITDGEFIYISFNEVTNTILKCEPITLNILTQYGATFSEAGIASLSYKDDIVYAFSVDNPAIIVRVDKYSMAGINHVTTTELYQCVAVVRNASYFFVLTTNSGGWGINVYDISDLSMFNQYNFSSLTGSPTAICFNGDFVFVADNAVPCNVEQLQPYDLSLMNHVTLPGWAGGCTGIAFDGYNLILSMAGGGAICSLMNPDTLAVLSMYFQSSFGTGAYSVISDGLRHFFGVDQPAVGINYKILTKGYEDDV